MSCFLACGPELTRGVNPPAPPSDKEERMFAMWKLPCH